MRLVRQSLREFGLTLAPRKKSLSPLARSLAPFFGQRYMKHEITTTRFVNGTHFIITCQIPFKRKKLPAPNFFGFPGQSTMGRMTMKSTRRVLRFKF